MERVFVLLSVLLVTVHAVPIELSADREARSCSRTCTGSNKFNYVPGKTYNYKYESDIKTQVQGASDDHASLHLSAVVQLEILSKCEISMKLSDVTLTEYDPLGATMKEVVSDFKAGLEKFPVRISYQDGGIEEICLSGVEPTWVLNAKRGIVSLIQNNMDDFAKNHTVSETDVSGVCETEYFVRESGWYTTSIGKSKNLLGCTDRHGYNTAIQGVPYTAESDIQSLPLLKSDHNCVHEVDKQSGFLKTVKCTEQHMFRPFSQASSGAITTTSLSLTYLSATTGTKPPAPIKTRVSLKFDHVHDLEGEGRSRKDITRKLMEICEKTKSGVRPETPKLFTDLVYMMKSADIDTLTDINKMLTEGTLCPDNVFRTRKYFLDAIPMAGTSASLRMITELITSNIITGVEADMWLTTLSFIKNPTIDMLKAVKPLINAPDTSEKALLSVGTLVHSYCLHHGNCDNDDMVKAIVSAFTNKMSKGCKVKDNNMKTTLLALRGIGNIGYAKRAIPTLTVCMKLKSNPVEIRLSAIEAFRRMPCDSDRVALMAILQDTDEDSEIRIAAYRVLMECPSDKILGVVRNTLAREEVNQVGSYIWTHLTNLMETSDRHKQDIRALLEDETFKKEFDLDKRKFSRNYEGSVFIERLNTGAKAEGDLIWSSKSFIPRSGMMNLTFDLFGHSVNLFEIGGRAEGLEYFLESFFGPNGYFGNPEAEKSSNEIVPKNIRGDKMKKIEKRFTAQLDDLRGSLYMRVFGNELRYMNFKGIDSLLSGPEFNMLDMLIQLSEDNDYTYTHSAMFLDSSYIVPTCSGFPLNLTVNGTATVDLRMKGKMDLRHPPTLDIAGRIQPSAAVDISSMMSVDAFVTKSGIKMVSTLHTSTALEGKLSIDSKGSITTEYEMPEPRMEIIDIKSSFFTVHRDIEREQKMITENRQSLSYCSPEKVVTVTGLELCAEVEYPNASMKADAPYFPMTGPVSAGVYLYNRDTHVKYRMEAKSIHNKAKNIVHFTFNTPDSRIDRHVEVDFSLNKVDLTLDATLTSPWKKANVQGTIINTKQASSISGKMNIDGKSPYSFDAKLAKDISGNSYIFKPSIDIQANRKALASMKGMLSLNKNWKQLDVQLDSDGTITGPFSAQLSVHNKDKLMGVQGSMGIAKNKQYSFDVNLATTAYKKKILYKPLFSIRTPAAEVVAFGGGVTHVFGKGLDINLVLDKVVSKKITLIGKLNKVVKRRRSIYNTKLDFRSSPADFLLKAKFDKRSAGTVASDIDFTYVIRRIARNNIKLVSKITNQSSKSLTKAKAAINFAVKRNPEFNMKILSDLSHNKKHTEINGDIWYGADFKNDDKHIDMRLEMNRNLKSLMAASADIQTRVRVPELDFVLMMKGAHSHDEKNVNSNFTFKFGKGQPIETSLTIHDNTGKLIKIDAEYILSMPGYNLDLEHALEQTVDNRYISSLKTQIKKGQQNVIITTITPKTRKIAFSSDIKFFDQSPANLRGEFGLEPTHFVTSLSFEKESTKYAGSLSSVTEIGKSSWLTLDIFHPDRHMVMSLKGKTNNDLISGDAELQWNTNEKVALKTWFEKPTPEKINGSVTISYPTRTLILNAHHTEGLKYSSHVDFQWDPAMKVSADTVLDVAVDTIIGSAKVTTPFNRMPRLALETKLSHDNEQYNADASVSWEDSNKVFIKSELKKPINFRTLVGSLSIKSSRALYGLKSVSLDVNHKLSNSLASEVRFGWNRQFIQTTAVLQNTTKGKKVGFDGSLDLKTSYQYIKKGKFIISHDNNGKNFNTDVNIIRNRKSYKMVSKITHQPSEDTYENTGSVSISSPNGNVDTTWNHKHSAVDVATLLTSSWGKNKNKMITGRFNSHFDDGFSATFELQSPFKAVQDTSFKATYMREDGSLDSKLDLSVNGNKFGTAEIGYSATDDKYSAGLVVIIPDLNVDTKVEAEAANPENRMALASIKAAITPEITMSIEGTQKVFKSGSLAHTQLLWKSSFPGYEQVQYSYEVLADDNLATITTLQYSKDKQIKLESKFAFTRTEKQFSAVLTTPYKSMPKLQGGFSFLGDLGSFTSDAFIEIQPLFDKTSAQLSWNTKSGLISSLRIDLPVAEYPYFKADVKGIFSSPSSDINLKVEYMPDKIIQLELTHNLIDTALTLSAKAASPFGTVSVQHAGNPHDFTCKLTLEDSQMDNYGIDVGFTSVAKTKGAMTISLPRRRDITILFTHAGDVMDFNTHAEVQHNRMNSFVSDLSFSANDKVKLSLSGSLRTQVISDTEEYEAVFRYDGIPLKFSTHGEFSTTSLGKSQADVNFDMITNTEGNFVIKSPLIKNIKSSFNIFQRDHYIETNVDIIHGGRKIVNMQASLNKLDNVIGEMKLKTPFFEDIAFMTRFDGEIKSFVIRSEGAYGTNKADIDLSSKIDTKLLQQKISLSVTGMDDISAEINHNGDLSQLKSYGELNFGQNRHRTDIIFSNSKTTEGSFSLESPLIKPIAASFQISGRLHDSRSHAEFTIGSDISAADMSYSYKSSQDASLDINVRSPFIHDVSVSLSNTKREQGAVNSKGRLSIEGMADFDLTFSLARRPFAVELALNTPLENFTNFETSLSMKHLSEDSKAFHFDYTFNEKKSEVDATYSQVGKYVGQLSIKSHLTPDSSVSFEHEGKFNNFRGHAEYNIGSKKSEIDIFYSGLSRHEGLMTIKSHLTPDLSIGFEHDGTLNNFKSHGEYSIGFDKREVDVSVNVENDIDINIQYKCPAHGVSTAAFMHSGMLTDFKCHAEITRSAEKWEGDLSFTSNNKNIQGQLNLKPSYSSELEPLKISFEQTLELTNFKSHSQFMLGEDKTTNVITMLLSERVVSATFRTTSPYYTDVSANFRSEGEPKNFNLNADFVFGSDQMDTDFAFEITNTSVGSSFSLKSSLCKDIVGSFNLQGKQADFSSDININIDNNENTGHISFKHTGQEVASSLDIKSAYMDDISLNLHHSGALEKFTTQYDTTIAGKKNKALVALNLRDNVSGKLSIDQPKFSVEGSLKEGVMSASLSKNLDQYTAAFSYSLKDKFLFDGKITSPCDGYRTISASFEHSGSLRNFKCTGKCVIEGEESAFNFRMNTEDLSDLDGSFDVSSPYLLPIDFKINNVINSGKYISNIEFNRDNQMIYGFFASLNDKRKGINQGNIELFVNGIKHKIVDVSASPSGFRFSSEVFTDSNSNKMEITFSHDPKLFGSFSVMSQYFPQIQASIDFEGNRSNFVGSSDFIVDGEKKGHIRVSFNTDDKTAATFTMELPVINCKELSGEFTFIPGDSAFKLESKMTREFRNLFELELDIDTKTNYHINFALESKEPHPLSAKLYFTNANQVLKINWELIHASQNLVSGNVDLTIKKEPVYVHGTTSVKTQNLENSLNIHIEPDTKGYKIEASFKRNEDTWSVFTRFDAQKDMDAEVSLEIPRMEKIRGTFTHTQRTYRSKTNAKFRFNATRIVEYDMDLRWRNGLDGIISVTTPFEGLEKTKLKIEHEGSFPSIKSSVELKIAEKVIGASATISGTDSTKAEFTLTTPYEQIENLALSIYHDGELSNFRTGGRFTYATGEDIELDVDHMWIGMTQQTKARFMSPYTDEVVVSANHSGTIADFSSAYELVLGTDLKYMSKTSLKTGIQFLTFSNVIFATMSGETYEQKIELKHDGNIEKFKTEAFFQFQDNMYRADTSFQLDPVIEGSIELVTPFKAFKDIKASFTHSGSSSGILTTGEVQFAPLKKISGKVDVMQYGWRRMVTNIELRTPFKNMKVNKVSYQHSGDSDSFQCDLDSLIMGQEVTGTLAASMDPLSMNLDLKTPLKGYETIGLNGNFLSNKKNQFSNRMQVKWNPTNQIIIEGKLGTAGPIDGEISIMTPFTPIREASVVISQKYLAKGYLESLKITHNSKSMIDVDVDHSLFSDHKHILVTSRAPKSMKFELDGEFTLPYVDFDLEANWNTEDINSNLRTEAAYDVRSKKKTASFKFAQPGKILSFTSLLNGKHSKADLAWGLRPEDKVGYEITTGDYDGTLKLILPTRSLVFAGSHRGQITEGSFMWDADVDETRKVGFSSRTVSASDVVNAYITIMMPSLGKNIKVGSEISVHQGRVIFDGKTVLSYSGDSRKNLVFTSKLEDISTGGSQNYSFSFGVSHPYTTLGVTVNTHAGKSKRGYSAGVGLEYLTVKRQTKKFQIGARIDKLMKTISFELQSPIKSVSISGSAQTDDKFRLSLLNIYDQRQPLSTTFTFDSTARSIDFVTHYDLDNPRREFHLSAKYVNSSAIAAEMYHIVNRDRVTDVLITARLNSSHLLHSRLHWRPETVKDLEAFMERKKQDYNRRLRLTASRIEPEIAEEVTEKFRMMWDMVEKEIGVENIASFEAAVVPFLDLGLQTTIAMSQPVLQQINEILSKSRNSKDIISQYPVGTLGTELATETWDTERLESLKQMISDNFNMVSDQMKLPAKHIPGYVRNVMTDALNYTADKMPAAVSSQIRGLTTIGLLDAMESFIGDEILAVEKEAEKQLRNIEDIIMGHIKSPFTVYDPAHGEIQVELYSLIPLQSLDKMPVINFLKHIEKIRVLERLIDYVPEVTIPDITAEWVPPFTGVASVTLGHKITTFDGYVYDLNNDCTYILTRDYTDGNFSLILSNDGYTTLTVLSSGKPISINMQGEVLVGGELATLPFTEGYVTVTQSDNGIVTIKGGNHFNVEYDLTVDHMKIELSGWYHGRTGGLLGIYDNEPSNDKMTSFNKVVGNSSRFAKTWDVGTNSCR
ncbi:uncharacterized protein LOC123524511 [Mercenaria mercenaria]|uniref:uncharacterized protein LOC123524511 n=1 Tax=Mercenaria mercenaria TaxID=6596 RepID=UPI00234EDA24|nr:uncharacterized protein LOC123524511 [Mercenaria mercenaria]